MRINEVMMGLIEEAKKTYNIVPGSIEDRSIDDMLTRESVDVVHEKIVERYEGAETDKFAETMAHAHNIMEDHKHLPPEEFRDKWRDLTQ